MHQTPWSPERPLPPPVSLTSQSHHEKPPEVTCTSRGKPGFPASTRESPPIISALRDRLEFIDISGYTEEEKLHIAKRYLVPRQYREHGIDEKHLLITDEAILKMINEYTREAGLRNLEREVATICRKVARLVAEGQKGQIKVTSTVLQRFLGAPKFLADPEQEADEVGVATGLAWTQTGDRKSTRLN